MLRVLSLNAAHGGTHDPDGRRRDRWPDLARVIIDANPDVVLLQEVGNWGANRAVQHARAERDLGMRIHCSTGPGGTGAAIAHRHDLHWTADDTAAHVRHFHAFEHLNFDIGGRWPLTIASVQLTPYSAQDAAIQMQRLNARLYRWGRIGLGGGDFNHIPLNDPDPDFTQVPPYNVASRAIGDPPRGNRAVAEAAHLAGLTDIADHLATTRHDNTLRRPTAATGRIRVDWFLVTPALKPAIRDYHVIPAAPHSDHDAIIADLELGAINFSLAGDAP